METAKSIAETGTTWLTAAVIDKAKHLPCPMRGPLRETKADACAQCMLIATRHGKPHAVNMSCCKICQVNGPPTFANPFLRCLACHLAWNDVIAGKDAVEPLSPSDADIDTAIGIIVEYRDKDVARGFVEALVWHESITQEKGDELIDLLAISERAD